MRPGARIPVSDRQPVVLERYREIRRIGDDLLQLLQPSITEAGQDRIDSLIGQREAAIEAAARMVADVVFDAQILSELDALIQQQRLIEAQMRRVMAAWQQSNCGVHAARGDMQGVRRLLQPKPQSNLLNERR